jgi:transcriptional regulator with XRE-family HTH domain
MASENEIPPVGGEPADRTDALAIIRHIVGADADLDRMIQEERVNVEVAQLVYDVRTRAGLSQGALAARIGAPPEDVESLEEADAGEQTLALFARVLQALNLRLAVRIPDEEGPADPLRSVFQRVARWLRQSRGLSIDELALASKVKREELLAMERSVEHRPSLLSIRRLAQFYGLSQSRLAQLARAHKEISDDVRRQAAGWARRMERFTALTPEANGLLEEVVSFLGQDAPEAGPASDET